MGIVRSFYPSVSLALACLLCASVALPCSPEFSKRLVRLPGANAQIPANLVRFRVLDEKHVGAVSLSTAKGVRVATHVKDGVLTPDRDPEPGELVLTYPSQLRSGEMVTGKYRFTVLAAAPLELRPALIERQQSGVLYPDSPRNQAAFVRLRYYPPDANGNAAHLLENTVTVDGRAYQLSNDGGAPTLELKAMCQPFEGVMPGWQRDTCGKLYAVPLGKHTVTVAPRVLGETSQPNPVSFEVTLDCANATVAATTAAATTAISPAALSPAALSTTATTAISPAPLAPEATTAPFPGPLVSAPTPSEAADRADESTRSKWGCAVNNPGSSGTYLAGLVVGSSAVWRRRRRGLQ
jgi:hypothetical protein